MNDHIQVVAYLRDRVTHKQGGGHKTGHDLAIDDAIQVIKEKIIAIDPAILIVPKKELDCPLDQPAHFLPLGTKGQLDVEFVEADPRMIR